MPSASLSRLRPDMSPSTLDELALAPVRPGDLVLDIGSGRGEFSRTALATGCRVIAVDASFEACRDLGTHDRLQVIHGAVAPFAGMAKFVPRLGRVLVTNARDGVSVPVVKVSDLLAQRDLDTRCVIRVRTVGQLAAAVDGGLDRLPGEGGSGDVTLRLMTDALFGDDAASILVGLAGWSVTAATAVGLRCWASELAAFVPTLDWLLTTTPSQSPAPNGTDLVQLAMFEGRSIDAGRRARMATALRDYPISTDDGAIGDLLDELALDPDPMTWHAAQWWRSDLRTVDHVQRSRRRAAAHDRVIVRLAGRTTGSSYD